MKSNMFRKSWFRFLVFGVLMICLSAIIFGGLMHTLIMNPGAWIYLSLLAIGGSSSLVSGILMLYDSAKMKIKQEIKNPKEKSSSIDVSAKQQSQEHIKFLSERCERLKPEKMRRGN